jgi:2-polyprenyl-3-methyl-5-hydroxy-6-metoxy-1,4-benzoquinol methylase
VFKNKGDSVILKNLLGRVFRRYRDPYMIRRDTLQLIPTYINVGNRAIARKIKMNGSKYFKKTFKDTEDGVKCFHNEMLADKLFGERLWKVPVISKGPLWFTSALLPKEKRLDIIVPKLDEQTRIEIARQSMSLLFDIFFAGYAHRDFNVKNLFWVDQQLKLVDFEFLESYPKGKRPPFPLSYDVTGQGLESPCGTGNMGYTCAIHPKVSLHHVLRVSPERAIEEFQKDLKNELRRVCQTFKTRRKRHCCGVGRIYSSFELPYFSVKPDEAQRNSAVRFQCFDVRQENLHEKRILDLGSNIGGMLFSAQQYSPLSSFGIEYDADKVLIARKIAAYNGLNNVEFIQADIDHIDVSSVGGPFDVVFCLAIEAHVKRPQKLFKLLSQVSTGILYFEGNARTDSERVKTTLIREGFDEVRILGVSEDDCIAANNNRPLIIARKYLA